jgi:hypothetical protein
MLIDFKNQRMAADKNKRFRELIEEAAKLHPALWKSNGELNVTAVARFYELKKRPISQPTLKRLLDGEYAPSNETIEATWRVFGIPRELIRGDEGADMNELLSGYGLPTLLLAKKMAGLPKEDFDAIAVLIEQAATRVDRMKQLASDAENVTPFDRRRKG